MASSRVLSAVDLDLLDVLLGLLEYRDPYFRGGSSFVRLLSVSMGRELGLSSLDLERLGAAALLRDLGRIAMRGELISPFSPAPAEHERLQIQRHVTTSLELLGAVALPDEVRQAIRHHHESWNGSGYPDGLAGERIPLLARILTVADAMGAMLSPRPYRPPKRAHDALRELRDGAGTLYDPAVVEALVAVLRNLDPAEIGFALHGHLLLVHGDEARATTLAVHLGSHGFLVDVATDLRTARDRLARVPFLGALVAADAPAGVEECATSASLVAELRNDPRFATIPIIALDVASPDERLELIRAGFDACFSGSTAPGEIVATMNASLRRAAVLMRYLTPEPDEALGALIRLAEEPIRPARKPDPLAGGNTLYALQGSLGEFPLVWLLQAMQYDRRTGLVHLSDGAADALLALENGELVHAAYRDGEGEAALERLLGWQDGTFRVQHGARADRRTVHRPLTHLILEHARRLDERQPIFGTVLAD